MSVTNKTAYACVNSCALRNKKLRSSSSSSEDRIEVPLRKLALKEVKVERSAIKKAAHLSSMSGHSATKGG